jgi:hypothetical protein
MVAAEEVMALAAVMPTAATTAAVMPITAEDVTLAVTVQGIRQPEFREVLTQVLAHTRPITVGIAVITPMWLTDLAKV